MGGDVPLTQAFADIFGGVGDLLFRFIPAALSTIAQDYSAVTEREPFVTPVSAPELLDLVERGSAPEIYDTIFNAWTIYVPIAILVSLLQLTLIAYCLIRVLQIRREERAAHEAKSKPIASLHVPRTQLRWQRIQEHINSDNEHSWRLAILECDIMLNELLDVRGYRGETMAEKMKGVERGDWNTIALAWEVHKVRNSIAHEGSEHALTGREARRVVGLYEQIFKEFKF